MPLTALDTSTENLILSLDYESGHDIRTKHPPKTLLCPSPDCQCPLAPRDAKGRILHFFHIGEGCKSLYKGHPPSAEHELGKVEIGSFLLKECQKHDPVPPVEIRYEFHIKEIMRRADVALVYPNGSAIIGECQLSAITTLELQERTDDYALAGFDVKWWLGGKANTQANREWCFATLGECNIVSFIYEDILSDSDEMGADRM